VWLQKAYDERSNYIAYIKVFLLLDSIRSEARFAELINKVAL